MLGRFRSDGDLSKFHSRRSGSVSKKKKKKEGTVSRLFLSIKIFIRSSTRMMMTEIVSQGLVIKKSDELNQASIPRILTYER